MNLSHNKILEDQPKLTVEDEQGVVTLIMSERNLETMSLFKDFIKYNYFLETLNLENTGLIEPAIRYIGDQLTRSQGLRCVHLCANEGITPGIKDWLRRRIRAKDDREHVHIQPWDTVKKN